MKKSKKILFVILLLILLIVVGLLIWFFTKDLRLSKEEKIVNDLTNMGNEIYMSYYYPSVSSGKNLDETKEFLQKYETIGLKFNLTELEKYSEDFSNKIKNFKNGDDISNDDLKDYFEDIYDNHTLFNLSLLTKYSDNNSYPYIKSISYKDDKIHIYNNVVKKNVSIDILEIYSVDNSELEQYIAKIYYDTEDELKEFKSSFSLALLTLSESINTYNVSKA